MSAMAVVYEVEDPVAAHAGGPADAGGEVVVVRVHAAPTAPGMPGVPGPRTFCGRDTFAIRAAPQRPGGGGGGGPGAGRARRGARGAPPARR
ncbi:hypothetical protein, partial [Streptomyces erythrochromogenes]|uniref:hypothetical protein n=1 Tax=Streptomyces erythrochromogenes TaxID=285574 RepID=UPI0036A39737